MPKINRESPEDAQKIIDEFIADESAKHEILLFLTNAIIFANDLNHQNWNLNLDKNGGFIRLNVGQEYCIQISSRRVYVLTLKEYVREKLAETQLDIEFIGYDGEKDVTMPDLENVPDMLTKVPGSVVCSIKNQNLISVLPYLEEANRKFIIYAIENTAQLPKMIRAHSTGFITYLSQYCQKNIPNPAYIGNDAGFGNFDINTSSSLFPEQIDNPQEFYEGASQQITVNTYERNAKARSTCIKYYGTKCIVCGLNFQEKYGEIGKDYIHVHHTRPLGEIGAEYMVDPINDLCPVCPNCHAMLHRRKPPFSIDELRSIMKG